MTKISSGKFLKKSSVFVLKINKKTSFIYGKIKFELKKKGAPIPENDIWIAAQSVETDSILITYDQHFLKIKGLKLYPVNPAQKQNYPEILKKTAGSWKK